jgi:hypothetical protein
MDILTFIETLHNLAKNRPSRFCSASICPKFLTKLITTSQIWFKVGLNEDFTKEVVETISDLLFNGGDTEDDNVSNAGFTT